MKEQDRQKDGTILKKQHIITIVLMIAAVVFFFVLGLMMNNCSVVQAHEAMSEESGKVSFDTNSSMNDENNRTAFSVK